jgi:LmbE family N-acetylglucosaminyl deacetylase
MANRAYNHQYDTDLITREKLASYKAKEILGYQEAIFLDLPDEQLDRSQIDLIVPLEKVINQVRPDLVYFPHRGDLNQDHRAVFSAVLVACRPQSSHLVAGLIVYEVPSSTDQIPAMSSWPFKPNYYVEINNKVLSQKIAALESYHAELRSFPHPRSSEGISILAKKRGIEVGLKAAEAFMILRALWQDLASSKS